MPEAAQQRSIADSDFDSRLTSHTQPSAGAEAATAVLSLWRPSEEELRWKEGDVVLASGLVPSRCGPPWFLRSPAVWLPCLIAPAFCHKQPPGLRSPRSPRQDLNLLFLL